MKKITIHQPESFPWLGFFNKMMLSDEYVVLDNVQFRKNYFQNRNQFLTKQGPIYLTIPIDFKNYKYIKDIKIKNNENWQKKHLNTIKHNYSKHKYFDNHIEFLEKLYSKKFELLIDLNMEVINYIKNLLDIKSPIIKSSELGVDGSSTQLLLDINKHLKADIYISGRDGRNYLNIDMFKNAGINVVYHNFTHPLYYQYKQDSFTPYMSTFDLLFNYSANEAKDIILNGGNTCDK